VCHRTHLSHVISTTETDIKKTQFVRYKYTLAIHPFVSFVLLVTTPLVRAYFAISYTTRPPFHA